MRAHQGLVLITGQAGSGKSTTLAAMVDLINSSRAHHVLTVEDPIEYVHSTKQAAVTQRQLGTDTSSFPNALRAALRQDPDVIMVGEMRDLETTPRIRAAETGHLVFASMNTSSAHKTVDKIIDSYPSGQQNQIRAMLGESLKVVFSQRLLPRADGKGVVLALRGADGQHPARQPDQGRQDLPDPEHHADRPHDGKQDAGRHAVGTGQSRRHHRGGRVPERVQPKALRAASPRGVIDVRARTAAADHDREGRLGPASGRRETPAPALARRTGAARGATRADEPRRRRR